MESSESRPNDKLTPIYIGEEIHWIPVIDYYVITSGRIAVRQAMEELNGKESDTTGT